MDNILSLDVTDIEDYSLWHNLQMYRPKCIEHYVWKGISSNFSFNKFVKNLNAADPILKFCDGHANRFIYKIEHSSSNKIFVEFKYRAYPGRGENNTLRVILYGQEIKSSLAFLQMVVIPFVDSALEPFQKEVEEPTQVNVTFAFMSKVSRASSMTRRIDCPLWENIVGNYPYTMEEIEALLNLDRPDDFGKFIFWHGPPGTGKTYLIRSLIQHWRKKAETIYITDPENFFGVATYMNEVLFLNENNIADDLYDDEEQPIIRESKLKLYIIEDGLDFILKESRGSRGDAMSRLLNLTDGILGQGLRHIFLVTSNELIEDIDTAFLRAGRMLHELEFAPFEPQDVVHWTKAHGVEPPDEHRDRTLSELYELANKDKRPTKLKGKRREKRRVGIV